MNVIFLDIDGVISSINKLIEHYNKNKNNYFLDEKFLKSLKQLVEYTDFKIVMISSSKKNKITKMILLKKLKEYGIDNKIIGNIDLKNNNREEEIQRFLKRNINIKNYVVIENSIKLLDLMDKLIKTDVDYTKEATVETIKKLEKRIFE